MEKKLLLGSDYDGTFRRLGNLPEPSDMEAVRKFRRRGHIFGIVTGRNAPAIQWVADELGDVYDFILCSSGGVCLLPDGSRLFSNQIHGDSLSSIYETVMEAGCTDLHMDVLSVRDGVDSPTKLGELFPSEGDEFSFTVYFYDGDRLHSMKVGERVLSHIEAFTQITSYYPDTAAARRAMELMEERFPGKYKCHFLGSGFDMTPAGVDKGRGLLQVARLFGVEEDSVFAVGDSWNDVDMLRRHYGIAMESAPEEVRAIADRITPTVGDAVEMLLDKFAPVGEARPLPSEEE